MFINTKIMFAFLDPQMIVCGSLVVCAIIALILTVRPKKQPPFPKWFKEVENLFRKNGYPAGYTESLNRRRWEERHKEGYTPAEAFYDYFE